MSKEAIAIEARAVLRSTPNGWGAHSDEQSRRKGDIAVENDGDAFRLVRWTSSTSYEVLAARYQSKALAQAVADACRSRTTHPRNREP